MAKTPSELQKRNRKLFQEFFVRDFSDKFLIDLDETIFREYENSSEFCSKYKRKLLRQRALGYLKYFDGSDSLDKVCNKHGITCESRTTNGHEGGEYLLAKTNNFLLAFSNNPQVSQKRTEYQKKLASSNAELGLQQGEFEFEEIIQKITLDDERFYVTIGLKQNSKKRSELVFNIPNADGFSMYRFYLKDLLDVYNELQNSTIEPRLDEKEAIVTLRAEIKKGML